MVGRVLIQALMWTVTIEVALVLTEHGARVFLVVDQNPVGALGPDAPDEAFRKRVRPRRPRWNLDHVDALGCEHRVEGPRELGVPVADQEPERRGSLAQILCRAKLSAKAAELLFPGDDQAARRYSLMAPPRTRCRRTGALIGTTVPGSWSGGRLSRL